MSIVTWPLEKHTKAKHTILKLYLDRWFPILGKYHGRLNYIDGFAGPGMYSRGEKGSPILAIESAKQHLDEGRLSPNVTINFAFVESTPAHSDHLRSVLAQMSIPQQFKVEVIDGEFRDHLSEILDKIESEKSKLAPTFAFVDPFGFSGIPLNLMGRILRFPRCEVFVNIMADFINRFLEHPNDRITSHFPETFGTQDVLRIADQLGDRLTSILSLYKSQLRQHAKFVGRFDMHGRSDRKTYSLFFGTNAPKGFEKMKEAMWAVDRDTGSRFSDFDPNPTSLFSAWSFEPLWGELKMKYVGKNVKMAELEKFVVEETDFLPTHARKILAQREDQEEIKVEALPGCKRHGRTFAKEKVMIKFQPTA